MDHATQDRKPSVADRPAGEPESGGSPVADLAVSRGFSARSVIASLLLGRHRPDMPAATLVQVAGVFGFAEGAVRVALSRMVAAGELTASDGRYALAGPLLDRHLRQEEARRPALRAWSGGWRVAVLGTGQARRRSAIERVGVRKMLRQHRLAEWREGIWLRPDNVIDAPPTLAGCTWLTDARFVDDGQAGPLAAALWDLDDWATQARQLRRSMNDTPAERDLGTSFQLAAAAVRHIRDDPLLPEQLLPARWPAAALRARYDDYQIEFQEALARVLRTLAR